MRMGSDAGRSFLSTKDPVKKQVTDDEGAAANKAPSVERTASFAGVLELYFKRRDKQ